MNCGNKNSIFSISAYVSYEAWMENLFDVYEMIYFSLLEESGKMWVTEEKFYPFYPSFQGSKARWFGIRRQVRQPEACRHVHDEADRVSILDLWHSHPINISLQTQVALFLLCWHWERHTHINKYTQRANSHITQALKYDKLRYI